ncbi:acyl carrier protein [bacterium]|jgi:acyl carrier protein|nr:acyl carrier protein [bacterium]
MKINNVSNLLRKQFPTAVFDILDKSLSVGSFPEWDSLAHFNFLLLVEESYSIRFTLEEISDMKSISDIVETLSNKGISI